MKDWKPKPVAMPFPSGLSVLSAHMFECESALAVAYARYEAVTWQRGVSLLSAHAVNNVAFFSWIFCFVAM